MNYLKNISIALLFLFITVDACSIAVIPVRYVFKAKHGQRITDVFAIANKKEYVMNTGIEVREGVCSANNVNLPVGSWLFFGDEHFSINPGDVREVSFSVKVPTGTAGMFSAKISFVDKTKSAFHSSITIPIYVIVEGTEREDWDIEGIMIKDTPMGPSGNILIKK